MAAAAESAPYTGPSPREMIESHTLAQEIINRNNDACPILDSDELSLLFDFVKDPSQARSLLETRGLADEPTKTGSLVAYVISLHGTNNAALTDEEIQMLNQWFQNGQRV
ncbi:uncharacterized protein BDZ83DRAFT_746681 [Colletotrichum acutatum]|uniref:Uncharacterized protein n=1 Tax=Glomerella acutata TaxID=27357 RepID=A0AAD8XPT5_GLOAC|nr:uncharacterized protein BDZ83DRAFT_746681 [Colletotrichum acutatum]KAK1731281.1 hypothetical protein BDZ83DRAFT_746681 [Colletotrichum acutatum]